MLRLLEMIRENLCSFEKDLSKLNSASFNNASGNETVKLMVIKVLMLAI